jgi:tetratricopeptide (TPR) repeat protein
VPVSRLLLLLLCGLAGVAAAAQLPTVFSPSQEAPLIEGGENLTPKEVSDRLTAFTKDDIAAMTQKALRKLKESPLDAQALQNLAVLLALQGEPDKTEKLHLLLARYSLRNTAAQIVAVNILSAKGNYDEALVRLDAVIRSDPAQQEPFFGSIMKLAEIPTALPAIARTLAAEPPWRKALMTYVATYKLLKSLRDSGAVIQGAELRNILAAWVKGGDYERAYFVWLDLLSDEELKSLKLVYDGQFSREARNQFFDWNFGSAPNVRIGIVRRPGSAVELSLLLDFAGFKGNFSQVSQMLRLSPGIYDVSFDQMAQAFKTPGGLSWRVKCLGTSAMLGQSTAILQAVPWGRSEFSITVPEEGCETQILRLESASTAKLDTAVTGQVYFDDMRIERRETVTPQ